VVALALDTSTRIGGVALYRDGVVLAEDTWQAGGSQTAQILPAAERLWQRAGLGPADLGAVVVATGPGSFTGLRVGASLGKGFAVALGIALVGVPTLDALAYQFSPASAAQAAVCAVVDAGRGQKYVGWYRNAPGGLRRAGDLQVLSVEELGSALARGGTPPLVAGELTADEAARVQELAGATSAAGTAGSTARTTVRIAPPAAALRRPAFLAEIGLWRLATGGAADPSGLQPIYLRRAAP
jgi:tRNA threonylcarbamoyladenosine biosynthesis protein TsaB